MSTEPDSAVGTPAPDESLVGRRVNKYEIVRVIGRGGMGTVYEALNTGIGKRVAMKFVDGEMARNKDAVARFQREAQAASAVESAHIVEIFDSGTTDDGRPYIVMELLRGEDLGHRIKRCGRLDLPEALHLVAQILRGLHRAHEAGIVHRDLKPDNIFLVDRDDDANFAKVLDFGISKMQRRGEAPANTLTQQGTVLGTPFYMSPEQAQALPDIDGRTDLWAVGAILFECLTGRPPHSGGSYEQVIVAICMKDVDDVRVHNPGVPEAIAQVLQRALTRDRERRFNTARELLDALVTNSGGILSQRSGRADDGATSGSGSIPSVPPLGGRTPQGAQDSGGFAPTLEVGATGGPSRVGWSTSRRSTAGRDRKVVLLVGLGALGLIMIGAFLFLRDARRDPEPVAAAASASASAEMVQLKSNVPGARFLVNGVDVPGGVLRGSKGDKKTVHVEADGFASLDRDVTIDPAGGPIDIVFETPTPSVNPASTAPDVSPATSSKDPNAKRTPKAGSNRAAPPPSSKAGSSAPPGEVVTTPPPAPKSTGVAGQLQLKTD